MTSKKKKKLDQQTVSLKKVVFTPHAWEDYTYWASSSPKITIRINELINDAQRSLNQGIGNPEKLSGDLKGYYSRRIDQENRLVYTVLNGDLVIVQARYHY